MEKEASVDSDMLRSLAESSKAKSVSGETPRPHTEKEESKARSRRSNELGSGLDSPME